MHQPVPIAAGSSDRRNVASFLAPCALGGDRFRSEAVLVPGGRTFGGRLVSEAMVAAAATADAVFQPHSAHAQFILAGDTGKPVVYAVERLRDGRNFCTRSVRAIQDDQLICIVTISLGGNRRGFERQHMMPLVAAPETLPDEATARTLLAEQDELIERTFRGRDHPVEFRPLDLPVSRVDGDGKLKVWFRAKPEFMSQESQTGRAALLAYASDRFVMSSSLVPHLSLLTDNDFVVASLDHALWIHRDYRPHSWLLHSIESMSSAGSRTFIRGEVFAENGDHVASSSQEGWLGLKARNGTLSK